MGPSIQNIKGSDLWAQ